MAKIKATESEIRALLISMNPKILGPNADPLVPQRCKFILTGKMKQGEGGVEKEQYTLRSVLSPEAKAANPNLTPTNYLRVTKTDYMKPVSSPDDVIEVGRSPWADNLFENQQPELFADLVQRLKDSKDTYFEPMPKDKNGLPRLKMKNPVLGAFIAIQVPGHYVIGTDGKPLTNSVKDISTGKFGAQSKTVMRELRLFLYPYQFQSLMSMAIARYQKQVEPMLAEEVTYKVNTAGAVTERKIADNVAAENIVPEVTEKDEETGKDDAGNDLP